MIDPDRNFYQFLTGLEIGSIRVFAGRGMPAGILPDGGAFAMVTARGGAPEYHDQVWRASMQVQVFASSEAGARSAAGVLHDAILNQKRKSATLWATLEEGTIPVLLQEPSTQWPYVLMYFTTFMREGA